MKNIAIYCRVSTGTQVKEDGSLVDQEQACRDYINYNFRNKNYNIIIYTDSGISGKEIDIRPEMKKLLKDVKSGLIQTIVTTKLDRMFRNVRNALDSVESFDKYNVSFISLKENFDTTTAMGRAMLTIMLALAAMEREITSERLKFTVREKAKRGKRVFGNVPYGYRKHAAGVIEDIPEEQAVVQKIFELYKEIGSFSIVRDRINAMGLLFSDRLKNGGRKQKPFIATTINNIIRNKFYINILELNKSLAYKDQNKLKEEERYYTTPGTWNACIDQNLFDECQDIADRNKEIRHNSIKVDEVVPFIFSGKIFCSCGTGLVGSTARKPKSTKKYKNGEQWLYTYYRCKQCSKLVKSEKVEAAITNLVNDIISKDSTLLSDAYAQYENGKQQKIKDNKNKVTKYKNNLDNYKKEKDTIINALTKITDEDTIDEYNKKLKDISRLQKMTLTALDMADFEFKHDIPNMDMMLTYLQDKFKKHQDFTQLSARNKKDIIQKLFKKITVVEDKLQVELLTEDIHELQFVQNPVVSHENYTVQTKIIAIIDYRSLKTDRLIVDLAA